MALENRKNPTLSPLKDFNGETFLMMRKAPAQVQNPLQGKRTLDKHSTPLDVAVRPHPDLPRTWGAAGSNAWEESPGSKMLWCPSKDPRQGCPAHSQGSGAMMSPVTQQGYSMPM